MCGYCKKLILLITCGLPSLLIHTSSYAEESISSAVEPIYSSSSTQWALKLPKEEKVSYKGDLNLDGAGLGTGAIMYPAPNAAGLIAALITHGLINETAKKNQKENLERMSLEALRPYASILNDYHHRELMQTALNNSLIPGEKTLIDHTESPVADFVITSLPKFFFTQDQSTIILDNIISVSRQGIEKPVFQNTIRVISNASTEKDFVTYWSQNNGTKLKEVSSNIFAQSLELAALQLNNAFPQEAAEKTIRYMQGNMQKMERGTLLYQGCKRMIVKTLRGSLMSIPVKLDNVNNESSKCSPALLGSVLVLQ